MSNTAPSAPYVYAVGAIWPPLCTAAVALRFYARRVHSGGSGWSIDDWLVVPAMILTWALGTIVIVGVATKSLAYPTPKAPDGESQDYFSSPESQGARRDFWLFKLCQIVSLTLIKLSFVFFYRRIFCARTNNKTFDRLTKAVIALLIIWGVAFFFSLLLACGGNFDKYWQSIYIVTEYCPHTLYWENTFAVTDMVMDLVVYVLPLRQVTLLNLTFSKKLALFGIFGFGAVTVAASILRMSFFIYVLRVDFRSNTDNDLIITSGFYWSMLESGLALLAVNLPPIYSLINIMQKRKRDKTMTPHNAYTSRRQWVQNLTNFRSVRTTGPMFSESEITGFKTGIHGEAVSLEDMTPSEEDQIRVENRVEVTWQDARQETYERPYSSSQRDIAFPLKAHSLA